MPKTIYLSFTAGITGTTTEQFQEFLANKLKEGVDTFYILLSSNGGGVKDGITLYHFLKSLPAEVIMHNIGQVNSVANVVFSAGNKRYAVEHSSFMFHGVGFDITSPTRFEEKELKTRLDSIQKDQHIIASILNKEMGIPTQKTEEMFLNAAVITSTEAKKLGIIHDVQSATIPQGAELFQLVLQK